jgi:hypothetical protein
MRSYLLAALAVVIAVPVRAAVLPFQATLEVISVGASLTIPGSGTATVNASGAGLHLTAIQLPANAVDGSAVLALTDPAAAPLTGYQLDAANLAGTIAETPSGTLRGAVGLAGILKVCLFGSGGCVAPLANLSVPLTPVGQGGAPSTAAAAVNITVFGAPWTTGTASIGTLTQMGFAHGPASGTTTTAQVGGALRLVTPIFLTTNIGAGPNPIIPAFAILTLHFVPEPVTALLLGAGIVALCAMGRRNV